MTRHIITQIFIKWFSHYLHRNSLIDSNLLVHQFFQIYLHIIHFVVYQSSKTLLQRIIHSHYNQKQSICLNFVHQLILRQSQVAIVKKVDLKTSKHFIKREILTVKLRRFEFLNCATLNFDLHHLKMNN